ncbi:MAG: hypothetical protein WC876_03070 [Candidatus Thermoplasmatota archaeon]|jgi:hypothetical protein
MTYPTEKVANQLISRIKAHDLTGPIQAILDPLLSERKDGKTWDRAVHVLMEVIAATGGTINGVRETHLTTLRRWGAKKPRVPSIRTVGRALKPYGRATKDHAIEEEDTDEEDGDKS